MFHVICQLAERCVGSCHTMLPKGAQNAKKCSLGKWEILIFLGLTDQIGHLDVMLFIEMM